MENNDTQVICDVQEVRNFVPEAGGVPQHLQKNRTNCVPPVHDVWAPHFARYNQQMQPDVRVPWFMLGVIYTGLFFLLADKKERR